MLYFPILDLRESSPKYIFVRVNWIQDETGGGYTFQLQIIINKYKYKYQQTIVPNNF
jgi:hypothetical protein